MIHYHTHNSQTVNVIFNQINLVRIVIPYLFEIPFKIILLSCLPRCVRTLPFPGPLFELLLTTLTSSHNTGYTQKNSAVSKVNKKFISHLTRAQRTPSAAATVQVSHALPAVRFLCLLRGRGASFQDGVAAGKRFLCAPF